MVGGRVIGHVGSTVECINNSIYYTDVHGWTRLVQLYQGLLNKHSL